MKRQNNNKTILAAVLIGGALGAILSVLGALLLSWLIHIEQLGQGSIGGGSLLILLAGSAFASIVTTLIFHEKRLLVCALSAVCFTLILLAMTALFFNGQYSGIPASAMVIAAGSGSVCLLGLMPRKKRNHSRRKIKNR